MRFSLSWLKEYLETTATLDEIVDRLTMIGLEVEEVIDRADVLAPFTVAEILDAEQHPNADRLKVCRVATHEGELQIVCGAPNARKGLKTVFAAIGTTIPANGMTLKPTKIRDVDSQGMMCSADEMALGENAEGIMELPESAKIGESFAGYVGADDPIIEIAITPDRADCLGVYGVARDLAASGLGTLNVLPDHRIDEKFSSSPKIRIENERACPLFMGRLIKGVKNGESPDWLKQKLAACNVTSHSILVDITNYLSFDRGRPLHVFDADKLKGDMVVRLAKDGETFIDLKENEQKLQEDMVVISDDSGVISLAGVMGGLSTGSHHDTVNVYIESALFDPLAIAKAGRTLGLISDARYRFERGVDPAAVKQGLDFATQLILDLCGGEAGDIAVAGSEPGWRKEIFFRPSRVQELTALSVDEKKMADIFTALGCDIVKEDIWKVSPPSWRFDLELEEDLVEEIMRLNGMDDIPLVSLPPLEKKDGVLTQNFDRAFKARRILAANGMHEVVTYSFMSSKYADLFGGQSDNLNVSNPISAELNVMRPSVLPNLIDAAKQNEKRSLDNGALFETGPVFNEDCDMNQQSVVAGVRFGKGLRHWSGQAEKPDVYTVKSDIYAVLEGIGLSTDKLQVKTESSGWYHPGKSGSLCLGPKNKLAEFGEIHPKVAKAYKLKVPIFGFEIFMDNLPASKKKAAKQLLKLNNLQPASRDFAFIVDQDIFAADLVRAVKGAEKKYIQSVSVFDVFEGEALGDNKKSIAIDVLLQPVNESFTDEVLEEISNKIINAAAKSTGAVLRS